MKYLERENLVVKKYELVVVLTTDPTEEEADRLYGIIDDATLSTIAGIPTLRFHREADSLEQVIRSAVEDVRRAGLTPERIEMEPDLISPTG